MVSPELIRRYPFFAGLSIDQIVTLAKVADEEMVETGHYFFKERDELRHFYIVLEGAVGIVIELPEQDKEVVTSTVGPGEIFAWSALVPPYNSTAGAKALAPCRVVRFDCDELEKVFEEDCRFGYLMTRKAAQVIRERMRDLRIESLAFIAPTQSI
jgi:CRP/FNR family cyclic AMP-dependent transcriptional regulator